MAFFDRKVKGPFFSAQRGKGVAFPIRFRDSDGSTNPMA
jgi:hypothetical protein